MRTIDLNRQLLGIEDLLIGFGVVTQTRGGQTVSITKINAGSLPFDETQSLLQWAQTVNLAELGAMTDELQAIYDSIDALNNLEANLVALNTLAQAINCLNNLCNNLTKLQNIDTNMTKLQNINTNMTKLQNIDTNMTKLQNIDTNMTKLSSIYSNMSMLQTVYNNMTNLNAINTQIIPHLSEILLVDDYAAQVSADKTTVANDKASVASMKLAVETIYDTFDDRFLGTKTSDPTLDNDGNPLVDGAMYFNTSINALKVYDLGNALWVTIPQIYLSGLLDVTLTSITTGDILTWNGSKWVNTRTPSFTSIKLTGGTGTAGTMIWNNTDFTYNIILNSDVTLQDGQEVLVPCVNSSASLISKGRPVMAVGTNGNSGNILVNLHDGTKANAKRIIGLATQDMSANNGFGFVTMIGKVRGINTTGSQYGETWVNGDILYVKATGNLTNIEPADTALKMPIAFVLHAHTNGTLYVRTTGIDENHDRDLIATKADKATTYTKEDVLGVVGNLSSPLLDLPLKNNLAMKAGVGSTTFTRASTATYIDRYRVLKTANIDVPRFEKEGYLNEGASTNLLTYSEDFMSGNWLSGSMTRNITTEVEDPYGGSNATKITYSAGITNTYLQVPFPSTLDGSFTSSIFVKKGNERYIALNCGSVDDFSSNIVVVFDLDTNTVVSGIGVVKVLTNGWIRISATVTKTLVNTSPYCRVWASDNSSGINRTTPTTGSEFTYIFGAQIEALPFATSYIPTTSSTVTRSADVLQVTRENNFPNAENNEEGYSVAFTYDSLGISSGTQNLWSLYVNANNSVRGYLTGVTSSVRNFITKDGVSVFNAIIPVNPLGSNKVVQTQSNTFLKQYINGTVSDTDVNTLGTLGEGVNSLTNITIGGASNITTSNLFGHISDFKVYDRELTPVEVALL